MHKSGLDVPYNGTHSIPAAIFTEAVHLKYDVYRKNGLPVPILQAFDSELAGKLYKSNYDTLCLMNDIAIVGTQAIGAILIKMIFSINRGNSSVCMLPL